MKRKIEKFSRQQKIRLGGMRFSVSGSQHAGSRLTLFQHNVEAVIWKRHAENAPSFAHRWYFGIQARRMNAYEGEVCGSVKSVVAVPTPMLIACGRITPRRVIRCRRVSIWITSLPPPGPCQRPGVSRLHELDAEHRGHRVVRPRDFAVDSERKPDCSVALSGGIPRGRTGAGRPRMRAFE